MERSFSTSSANALQHARVPFGQALLLVLSFLTLVTSVTFFAAAPAQATALPTGFAVFEPDGDLVIRGQGFTAGGRVQIVIVDQQGNTEHESVWISADDNATNPGTLFLTMHISGTTVYGPNGSQDPANGYSAGLDMPGLIDADSILVRAFDERTNTFTSLAVMGAGSAVEARTSAADLPPTCDSFVLCGHPY